MTSKSLLSGVPNAKSRLSFFSKRRVVRWARRDAKKYSGLQDSSPTHSIKILEKLARDGQHKVNQWLTNQLQPLREGNARILEELNHLNAEIKRLRDNPGVSGRRRKETYLKIAGLKVQLKNAVTQYNINVKTGLSIIQIADESRLTWADWYGLVSAYYLRKKALKLRQVPQSGAQLPAFEPTQSIDVSDFTSESFLDEDPEPEKKSR